MVGPQEVGMIIAFGGVICSLCTLLSVYLLMRLMPPQQVFVPVLASVPQPAHADISRLRQLTNSLPTHAPTDRRVRSLVDALSKASLYATIMAEDPDAGRKGLDRSINEVRDILQSLTS